MTKKETVDYAIKYLNDFFELNGFKKTKRISGSFIYQKKTEYGYYGFACETLGYEEYRLRFSVYKRDERIENICKQVLQNTKINLPIEVPIDEDSVSLAFGYDNNNAWSPDTRFPKCSNENDVKKEAESIINFMQNKAIPLLNKFDDLREIDSVINGHDFWETDWKMPFNLGGNFDIKRLIIAKLSGNPNFNEIVEKNYNSIEKLSKESGDNFIYDRNDLTMRIPYTINLLKNVNAIY